MRDRNLCVREPTLVGMNGNGYGNMLNEVFGCTVGIAVINSIFFFYKLLDVNSIILINNY